MPSNTKHASLNIARKIKKKKHTCIPKSKGKRSSCHDTTSTSCSCKIEGDVITRTKQLAARDKSTQRHPAAEAEERPGQGQEKPEQDVRRCILCQTTHTLQWRSGPDGKPNMCNACGLRFRYNMKKSLKKATTKQSQNEIAQAGSSSSSSSSCKIAQVPQFSAMWTAVAGHHSQPHFGHQLIRFPRAPVTSPLSPPLTTLPSMNTTTACTYEQWKVAMLMATSCSSSSSGGGGTAPASAKTDVGSPASSTPRKRSTIYDLLN